jgi:hypothetical protein
MWNIRYLTGPAHILKQLIITDTFRFRHILFKCAWSFFLNMIKQIVWINVDQFLLTQMQYTAYTVTYCFQVILQCDIVKVNNGWVGSVQPGCVLLPCVLTFVNGIMCLFEWSQDWEDRPSLSFLSRINFIYQHFILIILYIVVIV